MVERAETAATQARTEAITVTTAASAAAASCKSAATHKTQVSSMLDECRTIAVGDRSTRFDATSDGPTLTNLNKQVATICDDLDRLSSDLQKDAHILDTTLRDNLTRQAKQAVQAEVQASMAAHNVDRQSNTHPSSDTFDGFSDVPAEETTTLYDSSMEGIDGLKTRLKSASQNNEQVDGTQQKWDVPALVANNMGPQLRFASSSLNPNDSQASEQKIWIDPSSMHQRDSQTDEQVDNTANSSLHQQ